MFHLGYLRTMFQFHVLELVSDIFSLFTLSESGLQGSDLQETKRKYLSLENPGATG